MSHPELLQRLAELGFSQLPPERMAETADTAWAWGEATGDARYCVLWRTLVMVDGWWGPADGAVATAFADRLDAVVKRELPGVLAADSAEAGTATAVTLLQELVAEFNLMGGDPLRPR